MLRTPRSPRRRTRAFRTPSTSPSWLRRSWLLAVVPTSASPTRAARLTRSGLAPSLSSRKRPTSFPPLPPKPSVSVSARRSKFSTSISATLSPATPRVDVVDVVVPAVRVAVDAARAVADVAVVRVVVDVAVVTTSAALASSVADVVVVTTLPPSTPRTSPLSPASAPKRIEHSRSVACHAYQAKMRHPQHRSLA